MRVAAVLVLAAGLVACGSGDMPGPSSGDSSGELKAWPEHAPAANPPPAPPQIEAVITNLDALAAMLPQEAVTALFDPIAFGVTIRDLTDPELVAFMVRATLAQEQGACRMDSPYQCFGNPYYNDKVELVPVEFLNRYGTRLYGEIVLPNRAMTPPSDGPYPVILALQGLATNTGVYRWWHQVFADAGYLVFAFDFSGQGRSDNAVAGDPGNAIEEAQDALTYLFGESPVRSVLDVTRVGVIGHSMGAIATMGLQAIEPRVQAAVAAAPISASSSPFDANPIPVMIQTGDHDGPVAPIPFVNPAVTRAVYDKLTSDRAFIVTDAGSHAQSTNYPFLPTASWGLEVDGRYSLAWMDWNLRHDPAALEILRTADPHLSYLWDSEVDVGDEVTVMRGQLPVP
jgi:pimeloyl-ACP methyl ester carboxylesterase